MLFSTLSFVSPFIVWSGLLSPGRHIAAAGASFEYFGSWTEPLTGRHLLHVYRTIFPAGMSPSLTLKTVLQASHCMSIAPRRTLVFIDVSSEKISYCILIGIIV